MKTFVTLRGITFEVEYDFTPAYPMTAEYPGDPADAEIICVKYRGDDFTNFMSEDDMEEIVAIIVSQHQDNEHSTD